MPKRIPRAWVNNMAKKQQQITIEEVFENNVESIDDKLIREEDREKVIEVLEAKKALLNQWYKAISKLEVAIMNGEDTNRFFDGGDELRGEEYGYIIGCVDEDEDGISVFPRFRGQITLHKYADGSWG